MIALLIIFFVGYSCLVFVVDNLYFLLGCIIFHTVLAFALRVSLRKLLKNLGKCWLFALFVVLFNFIFDNWLVSLIIGVKILIVTNFAFLFRYRISHTNLANGLAMLFYPLKIFKVNVDNLALMLVIALNFISILGRELIELKDHLRSRNIKLSLNTFFTKTHLIFTMFFAGLLNRVISLENALIARGYVQASCCLKE